MRWALVLCALGTTAILQATSVEPAAASRSVTSGISRLVSLPVRTLHEPEPEVSDGATLATPEPPRAKRIAPRKPEPPPPSTAMRGQSAVARGWLVDETGAPVPIGTIRGMGWSRGFGSHRHFDSRMGYLGYARSGIFVFRYDPPPPVLFGTPLRDGTFPVPKITYWVEAPGFATEEFVAEPEIAAALRRGDSVEGLTIVLQRGAVVKGTVLGPDGKPAAGVSVGVVDDPLALWPVSRTRQATDEHGRFRLVDLDPRRTLWIHARSDRLLARPVPLEGLHAGAVTHRTVVLKGVRETVLRFEIDATDLDVWVGIDDGSRQPINAGRFRALLQSGPHHCEFTNAKGEVVKTVRMWIEPHERERYELVRIDAMQD